MGIVDFEDEQSCLDAINALRADGNDIDWVCLGYSGPKSQKIAFIGSGSGAVEDLAANFSDSNVCYGLVRMTDQIDDSVTVKFAFINWIGENTPRMQKARISVHRGGVTDFVGQFHVDLNTSDMEDVTSQNIMTKIMDASGSGSRVLNDSGVAKTHEQAGVRSISQPKLTSPASVPKAESSSISYEDESSSSDLINSVRSDDNDIDWCAIEHADGDVLKNVGSGNGGVAELQSYFEDNKIIYALVRKTEQVDDSETIKFAFINWVGSNIPRMLRARLATHKGAVSTLFSPFHVDLNVETAEEISDDIVQTRIGKNSGQNTNVLDDTQAAGYYHN